MPKQKISFRMDEHGKVHRTNRYDPLKVHGHLGRTHTMRVEKFVQFKNAGKRTPSNKFTDPESGRNYAFHKNTFYRFDKTQPHNAGKVSKRNNTLLKLKAKQKLIDRRRADRTSGKLEPMDVGTYTKPVSFGNSHFPKLPKAKSQWSANNDHSPSGESIKRRNKSKHAQQAYDEGLTIAIDNPRMHASKESKGFASFSPTYGSRQNTLDTERSGTKRKRVEGDVKYPARAFHRDAMEQLKNVPGNDYSSLHKTHQPKLDFTQKDNQLSLFGSYRTLYRGNIKLNEQFGKRRGINPSATGQRIKANSDRSFTYSKPSKPKTQGRMIVSDMSRQMKKRKLTK